jgi:hypothetical protein
VIDRSLLTANVSSADTQSSRDRPVTPLSNVICRNRVGLFPAARHTSIDPRRTSRGNLLQDTGFPCTPPLPVGYHNSCCQSIRLGSFVGELTTPTPTT